MLPTLIGAIHSRSYATKRQINNSIVPKGRKAKIMNNEEYRKYIKEMVEQIENKESLKKIYNKVHNFFVKEDCIVKKKSMTNREKIDEILEDASEEELAEIRIFISTYIQGRK